MTQLQTYEEIGTTLTAQNVKQQVQLIQQVMKDAMVENTHYGVIPGCGNKPTLLKAGAEKLCLTFRLSPTYTVTKTDLGGSHREYEVRCTLTHIPSQKVFGEGVGVCSTMEGKYRYRGNAFEETGDPIPKDAKEKKADYRKQGFGMKKIDDKWVWVKYGEKQENPDIADTYNTVLKMAKKRAHVDAVLTATAASDIFAQDLEDLPQEEVKERTMITPEAVDEDKVFRASVWFREMIDADNLEENYLKVQDGWKKLNPNEQMAVHEALGDKVPGGRKLYRNVLKEYLDYVPEQTVPEAHRE